MLVLGLIVLLNLSQCHRYVGATGVSVCMSLLDIRDKHSSMFTDHLDFSFCFPPANELRMFSSRDVTSFLRTQLEFRPRTGSGQSLGPQHFSQATVTPSASVACWR